MDGVDEDMIQRYYGVYGPEPAPNNGQETPPEPAYTGNAEPPFHEAAPVPEAKRPFTTEAQMERFNEALDMVFQPDAVQLPEDVGQGWVWDPVEKLRVGRARKATRIELPEEVWKDRAIRWAKAREVFDWFVGQTE